MASVRTELHAMFFPFLATGHIMPLVDIAKTMTSFIGVKATLVTTPANAPLVNSLINCSHAITLRTIPFPSTTCPENVANHATPEITQEFLDATVGLEAPLERLIIENNIKPDCIISDSLCPWTTNIASRLGIPRIAFYVSPTFSFVVMGTLLFSNPRPQDLVSGDEFKPFAVPHIPHPVQMTRSQLPKEFKKPPEAADYWSDFLAELHAAAPRSFGFIVPSFHEMEGEYIEMFKKDSSPGKVWAVGPVALWHNQESSSTEEIFSGWLESKKPGSVVYVCFGSLCQFTDIQFREMAEGLERCNADFIWVVRNGGDESLWMPEGFEERVVRSGKGLVVRGWVPQTEVLNHRAIGCFVTHCGSSSFLEALSAGVVMITWPLFYDHFFNERLAVDVLRVGVAVGSMVSTYRKEEMTVVSGERLRSAIEEVMGEGEEAAERRRRMKEVAGMARVAVKEGGSSYNEMVDMIQELRKVKMNKQANTIATK